MFTKKIKCLYILFAVSFAYTSCNKALDINDNPNKATESTPELVLPQAFVRTSQIVPTYSTYGGRIMYFANAGGVSGWGSGFLDYNYSTGNEATLWSDAYDNLMDYQYVINNTEGVAGQEAFFYAAHVLKAYNFANLVDTYNDVPYSEAFKGRDNLYPKYDSAPEIYADLGAKLDAAIAYFKSVTDDEAAATFASSDVLFDGSTTRWAQFANTLKLKLVLKGQGKVTFATTTIDGVGVLTDDAIVNPTFTKIDNKQNPMWNRWAYLASGNAVGTWGTQFIPTHYVMGFYDGYKILDTARANVSFANGINAPKNQLGNLDNPNPPVGLAPSTWTLRPRVNAISATNYRGVGIIKGPAAGQPLMLAAEAQLLAAEAVLKGVMTGNAETYFENAIVASYLYLNKGEDDKVAANIISGDVFLETYKENNEDSYLVNYSEATSNEERLEAIITQKYIAMNFLFGHEAWNEFRRTGYPSIVNANGALYPVNRENNRNTFVSLGSVATTADKLPTRLLYPNTEFAYNGANIPEVDKFSSKIFWAK